MIGRQVVPGFDLLPAVDAGVHHLRQVFDGALDQSLGPARLLRLEGGHLDGQLGRALHILQIEKLPSLQLRAIAQIGVFRQGVVLPAARVVDGLDAPHSGRAVEIEEDARARAAAMLEHKVAVQQDGLDFGQK